MVTAPASVAAASVSATAYVPFEKASNSKTPIGPFHRTVLHLESLLWMSLVVAGPLSTPMWSLGIASMPTMTWRASGAKALAATTSVGRTRSMPFEVASFSSLAASSSWSSSTSDLPTSRPRALRNVNDIPPPMTRMSTFSISASSTEIFDETLAPPTTAANGRSGCARAPYK